EEGVACVVTERPAEAVVAYHVLAGIARIGAETGGEPRERTARGEESGRGERVDGRILEVLEGQIAHAGVREDPSVARDHEVGVRGDLADLQDQAIAVEGLSKIEVEDTEGGGGLPVAQRHRGEAADELVGRTLSLPPVKVCVKAESLPRAELGQVDLEAEIEIAIEPDPGGAPAGEVRPHGRGVGEIGLKAVGGERGADAVPVSGEVLTL